MTKRHGVPSVLLVDPHPDSREMYATFLRHAGWEAIAVDNAADALLRASQADVVVTGIVLNGNVDGIELVRRLRAGVRTKDSPIVVLTACAWPAERARALQAGCDAFLSKPCLPHDLGAEVRRLHAMSRARRIRARGATAKAALRTDRSRVLRQRTAAISRKRPK
jgi:CheY-like chemotaxis protein